MKRVLAVLVLAMLTLAGCGGASKSSSSTSSSATQPSSTQSSSTTQASASTVTISGPPEAQRAPIRRPIASRLFSACPKDRATMGCTERATPQPPQKRGVPLSIPGGALFPDVSVWQGALDWNAVAGWQRSHGWPLVAIFKLGEYTADPQASRNSSETARLGFWRAGYWFVRNTGCSTREGPQMIAAARQFKLRVIVEDIEVPEARGYAACLTPQLLKAGLIPVEYSAPGTNPDGGNPGVKALWPASYGPSHPPCLFTCSVGDLGRQSILAWQFTDGAFGSAVSIPGIGRDDVSVSYGIEKLGATPPKPPGQLDTLVNQSFPTHRWGPLNERRTGAQFLGAYKHRAKYRAYLRGTLQAKLRWLAGRISFLAVTEHRGWTGAKRGSRYQYLIHDAEKAAKA